MKRDNKLNAQRQAGLQNATVSGSGIEWTYFFGGSGGNTFDRYYSADVNGKRVEKHASNRGVRYAIGNIDEAKVIYKTESELKAACCLPDR